MKKIFRSLFVVTISIFFQFCSDSSSTDPLEIPDERGTIVEIKSHTVISKLTIQSALIFFYNNANSEFVPEYDVEVVSLVYKTFDARDSLVEASGVLIFPKTDVSFPLLSWHHGTQTNRTRVGSESYIYAFDGILAASIGYIVSEPDYLGLGISDLLHPYHHEETSAANSIDMLRAAKQYCSENNIQYNDQLFLAGYSQGGYVTLAVQKEIEKNYNKEFNITASAPMAGAHDLLGTALHVIQEDDYERPSFLAYLAIAYNNI